MIDTILFDLDGTLLPLNMERFLEIYFGEMGRCFAHLIEPGKLVKDVWAATDCMVNNTEYRTNETVFMEHFGGLISGDLGVYRQRFDEFYDRGFLKTREAVEANPAVSESIKALQDKGYNLVVATNPIFPEKAIRHRIRWAGFEPDDFSYIACYERNHYCKPQLHYYGELLEQTGKSPEQCLMVGNDVQEDMIAAKLGIQTYLITNHLIHRNTGPIEATHQGTYQDFLEFSKGLIAVG